MTPEQERDLFARVARLETFVDRVTGLLGAAGKVLDAAHLIARHATRQSTWTGQEPEEERNRER